MSIITYSHLNSTYDMVGVVGTMVYSVLVDHVGDDFNNYDVQRHIKANCYKQTKGTYMEASSLMKIVKKHLNV